MSSPFDAPDVRSAFGNAEIVHTPGLTDELLREMAPLLAEEGFDLEDPALTIDELNAALSRAVERRNLERFTATGTTRTNALAVLRKVSEAIAKGEIERAHSVMYAVEPEPNRKGKASVAHVIGTGLGLLDRWHSDQALATTLARTRIPAWEKKGRAAGTDIVALARKGRAFDSLSLLIRNYNGLAVLEGCCLAVAGTQQAWANADGRTVHAVGLDTLSSRAR
jgi:hypothetical protein